MKVENGILKGELKVKGGKLIKCKIKVRENKIEEIRFSGDFFIHPEEKIEELEEMLKGVELKKKKLYSILSLFAENVEMIGVNNDDFVEVIMRAKGRI